MDERGRPNGGSRTKADTLAREHRTAFGTDLLPRKNCPRPLMRPADPYHVFTSLAAFTRRVHDPPDRHLAPLHPRAASSLDMAMQPHPGSPSTLLLASSGAFN